MKNIYPRKKGKIDIFGDEIWIFNEQAENDPPYSIEFDSMEEYDKWAQENKTNYHKKETPTNNINMEKINENIQALEACINSSLTEEEDREKCRIQIDRYKKQLRDMEIQKESEAKIRALTRESADDKKLYVDVDLNMARKMRKAISDEQIPYRSKKLEDTFRIFVSNKFQQELVLNIYNEKRRRFELDEVDEEEVVGAIKKVSPKPFINQEKKISGIKSKIQVEKKTHVTKPEKQLSDIKSKLD